MCLFSLCITTMILIHVRLYCVIIKTLTLIGVAVMFCIKQLVIMNPVNFSFHKSVCTLKNTKLKKKMKEFLADHWVRTNYLSHKRPIPQPLCCRCEYYIYIYILAYASVTIHSIIYIC